MLVAANDNHKPLVSYDVVSPIGDVYGIRATSLAEAEKLAAELGCKLVHPRIFGGRS